MSSAKPNIDAKKDTTTIPRKPVGKNEVPRITLGAFQKKGKDLFMDRQKAKQTSIGNMEINEYIQIPAERNQKVNEAER